MFGYCPKCKNEGKVTPDYYDGAIEELDGFFKYCDFNNCKHGKELRYKNDHPILFYLLNINLVQFIVRKFHMLLSEYFWSDVKYFMRKVLRFPVRVWEWKKILFHDEDNRL